MSCGNSTNTLDVARSPLPAFGWSWKTPFAWLVALVLEWERRRQYRQLLELDDRLLADLGITRTAAEEARRSPLYIIAWCYSR
ncbi:MAG: DUF1127 domain-containing protein [bacterium]|nr:DUF1127 domain-containing protein [bacterium]